MLFICQLCILSETTSYTGFIKRNNSIYFTPLLSKTWKLSFNVKLLKLVLNVTWREIFNLFENGREILYLSLFSSPRLTICPLGLRCYTSQTPLLLKQWNTITMQQIQIGNQYHFQFFFNGNREYDRINRKARIYNDVTFYACRPGFTPANGIINQFQINDNYNEN